jgi:hypothetical protein
LTHGVGEHSAEGGGGENERAGWPFNETIDQHAANDAANNDR